MVLRQKVLLLTQTRTKSFEEAFYGADLFIEVVGDNGATLGLSYVPVDLEIGSGSRTDTAVGAGRWCR